MVFNCGSGEDTSIARRSNESIVKEINPEYSLEGLMLKRQFFAECEELTHSKKPWCWERLRANGEGAPSSDYSGLISFRMDWLDLLAVPGALRVFSNTTVQKHQFIGT